MLATVIPSNSSVNVSTLCTGANAGKSIFTGIYSFSFSICSACQIGTSNHLFLNLCKNIPRNYCFLTVSHIILRNCPIILNSNFFNEICCNGLLKQCITDIFFISQDPLNCADMPSVSLAACFYFVSF